MIEYQLPAPVSVALFGRTMCRLIWNSPSGMKTGRCWATPAATAASNALAESVAPVGSAPKSTTDSAPCGFWAGWSTSWESSRSIVYEDAGELSGTWNRILVPAPYT